MKSCFLTDLHTVYLGNGWWKLTKSLVYFSARLGKYIVVPAGFCTDFESVRRIPVLYYLFKNRAIPESVIHDWLWRTDIIGRIEGDLVFCEAMESRGKWRITRAAMTAGVMIAGVVIYNPRPGCLDYRGCTKNKPLQPKCVYCGRFERTWIDSIQSPEQFNPELYELTVESTCSKN